MPRPGPRRRAVPLRLSDTEEAPVRDLAVTLPTKAGRPNLSEAMRRLIAAGAHPHLPISAAGAAELDRLAAETGLTREEIGKLALTFAVARTRHWLPRDSSPDTRPPRSTP